jgi:excisionase family DNA binding protein
MIDIATEKLLTLDQAAEMLQVTKATVTAWIKRGTHGIRLEAIKFGAYWRTSEEAIQRFGDRQTPQYHQSFTPSLSTKTPKHVERAQQQAAQELDDLLGVRRCKTCKEKIDTGKVTIPTGSILYCPDCIVERKSAKFGERLRAFRWANQLSLQSLYDETGVSVDFLRSYESGDKQPRREHLEKLIEYFGDKFAINLEPSSDSTKEV